MAALPTTTTAFASGATEAAFKSFLSSERDFLAGLLGTDGLPATARAALGVTALTYSNVITALGFTPPANTLASITTALGYTAANHANAGIDHNHTGTYAPMTAITGAVYANQGTPFLRFTRASGATFDVVIEA